MPATAKAPSAAELATVLGTAETVWTGIIAAVRERFAPLELQWKPSKSAFGRICLLRHRQRTLLYLTPGNVEITVAIVLGERACALAMAGSIPARIKQLLREARPYAEDGASVFP
ncbi:MAG: DUF3788 family protein [Opitutaceae bacterium]|nr:DUF3788 family protein [Opitutaceae bacterium]